MLALVVDDEAIARRMLRFALQKEGFICHLATDGDEVLKSIESNRYDLIVTDLRRPNKHGHALAVQVLQQENRPFLAAHRSVVEPRVTKDLLARGVDDVVFKPTDYAAFAAKMRTLVSERLAIQESMTQGEAGAALKQRRSRRAVRVSATIAYAAHGGGGFSRVTSEMAIPAVVGYASLAVLRGPPPYADARR